MKIYYEECNDASGKYRWWQDNWPSDTFDIISQERLDARLRCFKELEEELGLYFPIQNYLPELD
jgi:hypothetical protein